MHIPKTSGWALIHGIIRIISPKSAVYAAMDRTIFGSFRGFDSLEDEIRSKIYLDPRSLPAGPDFVAGHLSLPTLRQRYKTAQYMTVLREPTSRLLSHWLFWRSFSDEQLRPWGAWGKFVSKSRGSFKDFLSDREVACQTDNLCVRMLLSPHRLIPENDFIDEQNSDALVMQALQALSIFAFVDVVENPLLTVNLQNWLGQPFVYKVMNQTKPAPEGDRSLLHKELTAECFELLEQRSKLDAQLWFAVAGDRLPESELTSVYARTLLFNAARGAALLASRAAEHSLTSNVL